MTSSGDGAFWRAWVLGAGAVVVDVRGMLGEEGVELAKIFKFED